MDKNYIKTLLKEALNALEEDDTINMTPTKSIRERIIEIARSYIGKVKYEYGGKNLETSIDCSGFTQTIYQMAGVTGIPKSWVNSTGQRQWGQPTTNPRPGDLVCYNGHVAIYSGNGLIIDSGNSVKGVSERSVNIMPILMYRNVIGD